MVRLQLPTYLQVEVMRVKSFTFCYIKVDFENKFFINFDKVAKVLKASYDTYIHGGHCEFLEYWNTKKSVWSIWQWFSCLLDEGIPKIWKELNSLNGFLSYLQNSTANSAHMAAHFCPALKPNYLEKQQKLILTFPYLR